MVRAALKESTRGCPRSSIDWEQECLNLPPGAIGKTVIFEWRLTTDNFGNLAGFYIDDVFVTGKE